jgi:hypothetical protein
VGYVIHVSDELAASVCMFEMRGEERCRGNKKEAAVSSETLVPTTHLTAVRTLNHGVSDRLGCYAVSTGR